MLTGTIIKGVGGFYYVSAGGEDSGEEGNAPLILECRARGLFRKDGLKPSIGDYVDVEADFSDNTGVITAIHPRKNLFLRPPVSNVDQFIVVMALADPKPNIAVLDRFLVSAEQSGVDAVICFTKKDLSDEKSMDRLREIYSRVYPLLFIDARSEDCTKDISPYLYGRKSVLAGPSGVGKSTILKAFRSDLDIATGDISKKLGRGRHTTRHVELFSLNFGGMLFDTPGFTSFDTPDISAPELAPLFPDIYRYAGKCRYKGCLHVSEPGCGVREALEEGGIHESRYGSYLAQLEDIRERDKKRYKGGSLR